MTRRALIAALGAGAAALMGVDARTARAMAFDKDQVRCATCHFWNGTRKAYAQSRVVVDVSERGRCNNPQSPYQNLYVGTFHVCPKYARWDQLD